MTNAQIITLEQINLAEQGVLKYTGRYLSAVLPDGTIEKVPEIETIHTYNGWKARGFQVKKGEKAVAKFPIWKYVSCVTTHEAEFVDEDGKDHVDGSGKMIMKLSAFFTENQVEKMSTDSK